jgi:hypothetical protein
LPKKEFLLIKAPFKSPTLSTSSTRSGHGAAENPAVQRSSTRGVEAGWIGLGINLNQCGIAQDDELILSHSANPH